MHVPLTTAFATKALARVTILVTIIPITNVIVRIPTIVLVIITLVVALLMRQRPPMKPAASSQKSGALRTPWAWPNSVLCAGSLDLQ